MATGNEQRRKKGMKWSGKKEQDGERKRQKDLYMRMTAREGDGFRWHVSWIAAYGERWSMIGIVGYAIHISSGRYDDITCVPLFYILP